MSNLKSISAERTVPVAEDLTGGDNELQILRGFENMNRVDKKVADGEVFVKGEWAVLKDDQTVERAAPTPVPNTYLVMSGTDRFDAHATGQVTLILSSDVIVQTNKFDDGPSYSAGDALTVKDLGGGESFVTKQSGSEPKLARVLEVGDGYLVYQLLGA